MSFADFLSAFIEILLSFSYSSKIEADIVIATSITAPNEPTKTPAINTNLYGRVKKSIASYLNPSSFVRVNTKRSEEHTSELQSRGHLVCRLLLEKKNNDDK